MEDGFGRMLMEMLEERHGGRSHEESQDLAARLFVNGFADPVAFLKRQMGVLNHPAVLAMWSRLVSLTDAEHLAASDEGKKMPQDVFDQMMALPKELGIDTEKWRQDEAYGASFYPEMGITNKIKDSMIQYAMSRQRLAENARKKAQEEAKASAPTN